MQGSVRLRCGKTFFAVLFPVFVLSAPMVSSLEMVVKPYLQYPTQTTMVVRWETDEPASSEAACGPAVARLEWVSGEGGTVYHEVKFDSLTPGMGYFYQVRSKGADGAVVESEIYTFQTAVPDDTPFSFVVFCDTQARPEVLSRLAELAWGQRPQFTLLGGDLVSEGPEKDLWTEHFFPNMHALNSRVPLLPCLGNHERDASLYYDYFSLPEPKYYYRFPYGNLEIFVVDSERPLSRRSEQYEWLDKALGDSKATWKIVCLHKPAYSSDEDDYGDTTEVRSMGGDIRQRAAVTLYEKHGVDIVWSGHIHSYERTYPLLGGKPVLSGGVTYMITGGGGGNLERPGPWRLPFSAKVYSGHHYCLVSVHGPSLRIEAIDLDGRIFDFIELSK
jgi:acid phosphatase type 7